jgi:hypothetical protein
MQLRDRLQARIDRMESLVDKTMYLQVINLINTELLEIEKQTLIDFHIECMKKGLEVDGSEWKELYLPKISEVAINYYNQTYNPK